MAPTVEEKLSQEEKNFITGVSGEGVELLKAYEIFDKVSPDYDRVAELVGVTLLGEKLAEFLCQFVGTTDLSQVNVIDVACGTGIIGVNLSKRGCKRIDGLDNSQGMLDVCSKKNVYSNLFNATLTTEPTPNIADNAYDVATAASCYESYGMPLDSLREVLRFIKPGGFFIFTMNYEDNSVDYMNVIGALIKENLAELHCMKRERFCRNPLKDFDEWCYGFLVALKKL